MIYGQIILIALLTWLTFWRRDIFLYIVDGIALIVFSFEWYDAFHTNSGITMALVMAGVGIYCFIMAIGNLIKR